LVDVLEINIGEFVFAQTSWRFAKMSIVEGKAVSLLEGNSDGKHKGWKFVVFESDLQSILDDSTY
jgi:hypothetical protein